MSRHITSHIPSFAAGFLGGAVALSLLGGVAYAATGGTFVLGRANSATSTTSLSTSTTSTNPLSLVAKSGYAPLKVNTTTKVANLNADLVDGLHSTSLATMSGRTSVISDTGYAHLVDDQVDNTKDLYVSHAACPAGSLLVGGGASADPTTRLTFSGPARAWEWTVNAGNANEWLATSLGANGKETSAYAICYDPNSLVAGSTSTPGANMRLQ